jgi:CO dehydrogenase maturation factor
MSLMIAVAGKGGVGKTTVSGLIVEALRRRTGRAILAVDADPNATLGEVLGLDVETTVGELQADTLRGIRELRSGVPLGRHIEAELHRAIVESPGLDLLTMGRGEGPGCYCAVNSILRRCLETLASRYAYVVLDNEAGLEHLSRRVTQGGDALIVVGDGNPVALKAAARIAGLVDELGLGFPRRGLLLNNLRGPLGSRAEAEIERIGLPVIGRLAHDARIEELNLDGRPLSEIPDGNEGLTGIGSILEEWLGGRERHDG